MRRITPKGDALGGSPNQAMMMYPACHRAACGTLWCLGASSARFCVHLSQRLSAGISGQCINVRNQGHPYAGKPMAMPVWVRRLVQGPTGRIYVE